MRACLHASGLTAMPFVAAMVCAYFAWHTCVSLFDFTPVAVYQGSHLSLCTLVRCLFSVHNEQGGVCVTAGWQCLQVAQVNTVWV